MRWCGGTAFESCGATGGSGVTSVLEAAADGGLDFPRGPFLPPPWHPLQKESPRRLAFSSRGGAFFVLRTGSFFILLGGTYNLPHGQYT